MLASIRVRLTLWYVLLLAVVLAAFCVTVYLLLRDSLLENLEESLEIRAQGLAATVHYEDGRPFLTDPSREGGDREGERFTRVYDALGLVTYDNRVDMGTVPEDLDAIHRVLSGQVVMRRIRVDGDAVRVAAVPLRLDGRAMGVIEVGEAEEETVEALSALLLVMAIAYPITLIVASLGGVFLARRALSPVDEIAQAARRVSAEDLSQRLDLALPDDEIGRLARTFDEMIARLDSAFRRQRQFTADASHELRTPLTIMKGQIEVSLQRDRDPASYRQVLRIANEGVDRLIRLVSSLLTLTRADAGEIPLSIEHVDLTSLVEGAIEQMQAVATQRGLVLTSQPGDPVFVKGDEDLLLQLILNLLDNAVKYTPTGGRIEVGCAEDGASAVVTVRDTGIGIAGEHLPRVFDRFYRVDAARSRQDGSTGLGLAISCWIAEAHEGTLGVESVLGEGSLFTLRLPSEN